MGTKCAPPYACLVIGYLEETILFPIELPKYFNVEEINLIKEVLKRYMDDGFLLWPYDLNFDNFLLSLNSLDPSIKFTYEKASFYINNIGEEIQELNFLDIKVILKNYINIETDIYYKQTNSHDYLPYDSSHPQPCKDNIPFNLAKRIIVFVSDSNLVESRLLELRNWLTLCKYPKHIITKAFHNAKLQGPAPQPKEKNDNLPFVTTYHENIDNKNVLNNIKRRINNTSNDLKEIYDNNNVFLSQRQPKNMLRILSSTSIKKN